MTVVALSVSSALMGLLAAGAKSLTSVASGGDMATALCDAEDVSQERPRPLIFRSFLRPSTGSSHATQDLHARLHTQGAHCRCHCHVMPRHTMSCQCHVGVMPLPCQCRVSTTSGPAEPRSCHVMQLRFSGSFSVFPAVSAAFQAFLSLSLLMHACVHMTPCRLRTWTIVSPLSCINRGLPALPVPHLSLLGSWAQVSRHLYQCR
jgi:hypothetical protein